MCLVQYLNVYVRIYGDPPETELNKKNEKKILTFLFVFTSSNLGLVPYPTTASDQIFELKFVTLVYPRRIVSATHLIPNHYNFGRYEGVSATRLIPNHYEKHKKAW